MRSVSDILPESFEHDDGRKRTANAIIGKAGKNFPDVFISSRLIGLCSSKLGLDSIKQKRFKAGMNYF
jgi:hypothetical protein